MAPPVFSPFPTRAKDLELLQTVLSSGLALVAGAFESWIDAAGDALFRHAVCCVEEGHWPVPAHDPAGFETQLAEAAHAAAASWIRRMETYTSPLRMALLPFVALRLHRVHPGISDLIQLSPQSPPSVGPWTPSVTPSPAAARVLQEGLNASHTAADLRFDVSVDWSRVGARATRDALLERVARRWNADQRWPLTDCRPYGPLHLTVRVLPTTPPDAASAPVRGRRRRA